METTKPDNCICLNCDHEFYRKITPEPYSCKKKKQETPEIKCPKCGNEIYYLVDTCNPNSDC